jgi:class 3 adenylate cyclase/tetratricopeptide (TPR) repeat protein
MPLCPRCGQDNPAVARFCLACGAALAPPEPAAEERRIVTVLFCDIVGSTATAEHLDPEDVRARLAPYYERVRAELERYGGTVEKFIGDAVVALFGAPVTHEDEPERAIRAALAVRSAIDELNAADEWLDLKIRVGINTGEALVVLDARTREGEGMASGDVMNTAARIQSAAPVNGIVVGEAAYRATRGSIEYRAAEPISAKGKSEPVQIWEVAGTRDGAIPHWDTGSTLVGRLKELDQLRVLWDDAKGGRRLVAVVVGAPGIGKSRLLREVTRELEDEVTVLGGRCLSYGEGITYWAITDLIKAAAGILQSDSAETGTRKLDALLEGLPTTDPDELRTIAAAVSNLIGFATTPRGTYAATEISRSELHWGVRRLFEHLATKRPLVLVLEDLHWAEPTLLDLIRYVAESDQRARIFILGSARPEFLDCGHALVAPDGYRHVVELDALGLEDSRAFLTQLAHPRELPGPLVDAVLRKADGNPLFLEEMVGMILDERLLDAGREIELEWLPVPDTVQALIGSRLDLLASGDKRVAQIASVVGKVFWRGAVATLAETDGPIDDSLRELERRDFVRPHELSTVAGEREYAFKHILIRDVAYGRLPKGRRAELHVRFADWTSRLRGGEEEFVEIIAYHLESACRLASEIARSPVEPPILEAVAALVAAAEKVTRREGWREAIRYYDRGLSLLGAEHFERALELRLGRGLAFAFAGEVRRASEELLDVAFAALSVERPDLRCSALITLGNLDHRQGRPTEGRVHLEEAQQLARESGDAALQVRSAYALAAVQGDYEAESEQAIAGFRAGLSLAGEMDHRALSVEGHLRLGFHLFNVGEIAASERELRKCTELAAELGSLRDQARAAFLLGLVSFYLGAADDAERMNLQARDWLDRTSEPYFQMQNYRALGLYALTRDDLDEAERRLQEAIRVGIEEGGRYVIEVYRFLIETLVRQGRLGDATALLEFASRSVPKEDLVARAYAELAQGAVAAVEGDRRALDLYEDAIRILDDHELPIEAADARVTYASALANFGEPGAAVDQLASARDAFERMGAAGPSARIAGVLQQVASGAGQAGPARFG